MTVQTEPARTRVDSPPLDEDTLDTRRTAQEMTVDTPPRERVIADEAAAQDTSRFVEEVSAVEEETAPTPKRRRNLRHVLLPLGGLVLIVAAIVGLSMYRESQLYVSTDNASITGTPVQVGSMNAGQVISVTPSVGSTVHKDDTLAVVGLPSQVGVAQNGQPKLGFLGAADSSVTVQSPIDGVVIAVPATPGASVQAGQALVTVVDPSQLWVNANIDETNIDKVKVGQPVTVHVDALNADVPGRVQSITPATAATFSLLPTSNTSGNFTKVTQQVPVRISVNLGNQPVLLGSSVEVKIQVA